MDISDYLPLNSGEYINCVRQLAALINKAMDAAETSESISESDRSRSLQRLADGVETVACLRGDSGLFQSGRTKDLGVFQSEMYHIEDALRSRLLQLGYQYPQQ